MPAPRRYGRDELLYLLIVALVAMLTGFVVTALASALIR